MGSTFKILTVCLIAGVLLGFLTLPPKKAEAAAVFGDPWNFLKEFVIRPLIRMIANQLENKLVNAVNKQIAKATSMAPSFITNWRNHFLDSEARGNDVFRSVLADASICNYMSGGIKTAFGADRFVGSLASSKVRNSSGGVVYENKTYTPGTASFRSLSNCTLPATFNVDAFNKDFTQGGWQAWGRLLEPQNNPLGVISMALGEQQKQIDLEKETTKSSSIAGQGFLSQKLGEVKGLGPPDSGLGPTGCTSIQPPLDPNNPGPQQSVPRCTFMGKDVTPAQILGKGAVNAIDSKQKRPGASSEITDVILNMFAAVLNGTLNRLTNYIGQNTYNSAPSQDNSFSENQFQAGANDTQINSATSQANQVTNQLNSGVNRTQNAIDEVCQASCMSGKESSCAAANTTTNCSTTTDPITGAITEDCQETLNQGAYDMCISQANTDCDAQCPAAGSGERWGQEL